MSIHYQPIGVIHSAFQKLEDMPIQPTSESSLPGTVEVFPRFAKGLFDLAGFSHIYLIYHFHRIGGSKLSVTPFLDTQPRGLFATRAPCRPNPIGLSLVQLEHVEGNQLHIAALDILDGTPLLDIKPYIPEFEPQQNVRIGWVTQARDQVRQQKSDQRFNGI